MAGGKSVASDLSEVIRPARIGWAGRIEIILIIII